MRERHIERGEKYIGVKDRELNLGWSERSIHSFACVIHTNNVHNTPLLDMRGVSTDLPGRDEWNAAFVLLQR